MENKAPHQTPTRSTFTTFKSSPGPFSRSPTNFLTSSLDTPILTCIQSWTEWMPRTARSMLRTLKIWTKVCLKKRKMRLFSPLINSRKSCRIRSKDKSSELENLTRRWIIIRFWGIVAFGLFYQRSDSAQRTLLLLKAVLCFTLTLLAIWSGTSKTMKSLWKEVCSLSPFSLLLKWYHRSSETGTYWVVSNPPLNWEELWLPLFTTK